MKRETTEGSETSKDAYPPPEYDFKKDLILRCFIAYGRAEGWTAGRRDLICKLLTARFGRIPGDIRSHLRHTPFEQVDAVAERILTAQTLQEALGPLYHP